MLRKIGKFSLYFFGTLILLILVAVGILTACNYKDEPLRPEVLTILAKKSDPTPRGLKAFYYVIGMNSGANSDFENKGREYWNKFGSTSVEIKGRDYWKSITVPLPNKMTPEFFDKFPQMRAEVLAEQGKIQDYIRMISYGELSFLRNQTLMSEPGYPGVSILKAHRWLQIYMLTLLEQKKWTEIEKLIENENKFHRSILGNSHVLATMISLVVLAENAHFLENNRKYHPGPIAAATIQSFQLPKMKQVFKSSLDQELISIYPAVREIWLSSFGGNEKVFRYVKEKAGWWSLLPNETINRFYDHQQEALNIDCPEKMSVDCYPSSQWTHPRWPWEWLRNPVGRYLVRIFANYPGRKAKAELRFIEIKDIADRLNAN